MIDPKLKEKLLDEVRNRVPAKYCFHNSRHAEDVHAAVCEIAGRYGFPKELVLQLECAALLHDIGFSAGPDGHEKRSADEGALILRTEGFDEKFQAKVGQLILSTEVARPPEDLTAEIMRDADVYHIGTPAGKEKSLQLKHELEAIGRPIPLSVWYADEIRFLRAHHFFLPWLEELRRGERQRAISEIEVALSRM